MAFYLSSTAGILPGPTLALESSHDRAATPRNEIHDLIDGATAVTLRPTSIVTGTLSLAYYVKADANTVFAALKSGAVFTYVSTSPARSFSFVPDGAVKIAQAVLGNDSAWVLTVPFRELTVYS